MSVRVLLVLIGLTTASIQLDKYCFATPTFFAPLSAAESNLTLVRAILITRHGDRTPVNVLPDFLEKNVQWNCSLDMLVSMQDESVSGLQRVFRKAYLPAHDVLPNSNCLFGQVG